MGNIYIEPPPELGVSKDARILLRRRGTRGAGQALEFAARVHFEDNEFKQGTYAPCAYWRATRRMRHFARGDDYVGLVWSATWSGTGGRSPRDSSSSCAVTWGLPPITKGRSGYPAARGKSRHRASPVPSVAAVRMIVIIQLPAASPATVPAQPLRWRLFE